MQTKTQSLVRSPFGEELEQQALNAKERENTLESYIKCRKLHCCIQPWAQICNSMLLLLCGRMQFVLTSVLVNCNNCGHNHTCSCALTHGKKVNRDSCLPECSAGEYTALARARLCRAVYFTAALYTGTHSSLCTFFPFVHRACIYSKQLASEQHNNPSTYNKDHWPVAQLILMQHVL